MSSPSSPARRLRRVVAGASLAGFPVVLIAQALTDPIHDGTGEIFRSAAIESRGALVTSMLLLMLAGVLAAPAVSGVLHQTRDRGAAMANAGSALFVLGGLAYFAEGVVYMAAAALPGGDPAEMEAYFDRFSESALVGGAWTTLIVSFGLGAMLLPWAAWRAGAVHWWVPALATVAIVAEFGLPFRTTASVLAILVALAVAYAALGLRVLRMTDAEWDGVRSIDRTGAPLAV